MVKRGANYINMAGNIPPKSDTRLRKTKLGMLGDLVAEHQEELVSELLDPAYQGDPMMRIALLAPKLGGEGMYDEATLNTAYILGEQLSDFDEQQRASKESQPFLVATYKPSRVPGWYEDLHLSYGLTIPGAGLSPRASEQAGGQHLPTNIIDLPVLNFVAIKPSVYTHEYFTSSQDLISVNGYRVQRGVDNTGHWFRNAKNSLILPTGKIFTDGAEPIVRYDGLGGEVKEIVASTRTQGSLQEKTLCAVGENSVREARETLLARARSVYNREEGVDVDMRKMFYDVDGHIVNGLRRFGGVTTPNRNHGLASL
jgi:hypothetical protein